MRKYTLYILTLIILTGVFSPVSQVNAIDPLGTCTFVADGRGSVPSATNTKAECTSLGGSWTSGIIYELLAPLPCTGTSCTDGKFKNFDPRQETALGTYLNIIIKMTIGLAAVLAVVMIVIGGIEYMTSELVSSKEAGKDRVTQAILGLILALGAYVILYTINPKLLSTEIYIGDANLIVNINDNIPQTPVNGRYSSGGQTYAVNEPWAPRAGPLADLTYSRASVYNSECVRVGQTNPASCTSTRGLNPSTLNTIRQKCPACVLSIQGGTEFWLHGGETGSTSHGIGSPTVDLGVNNVLTNYITGGQVLIRNKRYDRDGISYRYEVNHWHVGP